MSGPATIRPPTSGEYCEALQNPRFCLRDPELRTGRIVPGNFGVPKVISGNFASVFTIDCGRHRYALRCFTRRLEDQQERYRVISSHLAGVDAPWKVGFNYLPDEVLVRGRRFPALKMEWVDAESLIAYIERHLDDRGVMRQLAERFAAMVADLERDGVAHGDLQHGNILVSRDGDLHLVDYDGMFVPGLERHGAVEVGHPNYQSPLRTTRHFGPTMDRFSAWLIYTCLIALTFDPGLWGRLQAGDQRLLIGRPDLELGGSGRALETLRLSGNRRLSRLGAMLQDLATIEPDSLPPLTPEEIEQPATATPRPAATDPPARGHQQAEARRAKPLWVTSHFPQPAPVEPPVPGRPARSVLWVLLAALAVCAALPAIGMVVWAAAVSAAIVISGALGTELYLFRQTDVWRQKSVRAAALRVARREARTARRSQRRAEAGLHAVARDEEFATQRQTADEDQARNREQSELQRIDQDLHRHLDRLAQRRQASQQAEEQAVWDALNAYRGEAHENGLRRATVRQARLRGFDQELLSRLEWHGFATAAEYVGYSLGTTGGRYRNPIAFLHRRDGRTIRVTGIGPVRAERLDAWRRGVEAQLVGSLPQSLPSGRERTIREWFEQERAALPLEERDARVEANRRSVAVRQELQDRLEAIAAETQDRQRTLARKRIDAEQRLSAAERATNDLEWNLAKAERALHPYRRVTYTSWLRRTLIR